MNQLVYCWHCGLQTRLPLYARQSIRPTKANKSILRRLMRRTHWFESPILWFERYAAIATSLRASAQWSVISNRRLQRRPIPVSTAVAVDSGKRHCGIRAGQLSCRGWQCARQSPRRAELLTSAFAHRTLRHRSAAAGRILQATESYAWQRCPELCQHAGGSGETGLGGGTWERRALRRQKGQRWTGGLSRTEGAQRAHNGR